MGGSAFALTPPLPSLPSQGRGALGRRGTMGARRAGSQREARTQTSSAVGPPAPSLCHVAVTWRSHDAREPGHRPRRVGGGQSHPHLPVCSVPCSAHQMPEALLKTTASSPRNGSQGRRSGETSRSQYVESLWALKSFNQLICKNNFLIAFGVSSRSLGFAGEGKWHLKPNWFSNVLFEDSVALPSASLLEQVCL